MKSAYELAMERLEKEQGKVAPVSEKQKGAIAEIDQRMKAGEAELEITYRDKIAAARAQGDFPGVANLEAELQAEKAKVRASAEEEKGAVRRDETLA